MSGDRFAYEVPDDDIALALLRARALEKVVGLVARELKGTPGFAFEDPTARVIDGALDKVVEGLQEAEFAFGQVVKLIEALAFAQDWRPVGSDGGPL